MLVSRHAHPVRPRHPRGPCCPNWAHAADDPSTAEGREVETLPACAAFWPDPDIHSSHPFPLRDNLTPKKQQPAPGTGAGRRKVNCGKITLCGSPRFVKAKHGSLTLLGSWKELHPDGRFQNPSHDSFL